MTNKFEIEGIVPFNEFFFIDCSYNALFTLLRYYKKPILPLLVNANMHYKLVEESYLKLGIDYELKENVEHVLQKLGVKVEYGYGTKNFSERIKEKLEFGFPVIVNVDCYYEPMRRDTYEKEHLDHCFVVYGYEGDEFHILEHSNQKMLNYKPAVISKDVLQRACEGYIEHFGGFKENTCGFYVLEDQKVCKADKIIAEYMEQYRRSVLNNEMKREIAFSTAFIELEKHMVQKEWILENISKLQDEVNKFINATHVFAYMDSKFHDEIKQREMDICKLWNYLIVQFVKLDGMGEEATILTDVKRAVEKLKRLEADYYSLLISNIKELDGKRD